MGRLEGKDLKHVVVWSSNKSINTLDIEEANHNGCMMNHSHYDEYHGKSSG